MPYDLTPVIWATVIGRLCFGAEKLLETRPRSSGYYVLVANMYADYGCWEKLAKIRVLMKDLGVNKASGCASVHGYWLDVGHSFWWRILRT